MKTFEERFTAWVDGELKGAELAAFERELEGHPEALGEKQAVLGLGNLLRKHVAPAPLRNADFFNHQLMEAVAASEPRQRSGARRGFFWSLRRMALSGACLLLLSTVLYFAAVPQTNREVRHNKQYVENILNAHSDDPAITATSFHSKEDNVDVVWMDGLSAVPADQKLK